ncbi:hypothetical protein [Spirillospora sp. NPDC048819]|uniref:hypothetical protein n=1 Tax=Spirillospora sp. NPDC048819 TaxID=3155268 RepID=UPI0033CDAB13
MDLDVFTTVLARHVNVRHNRVMRVGNGLIHCAHCGHVLHATLPRQSGYGYGAMYYQCADDDCGLVVWVCTELVDRELQKFTRRRLSDPSPSAGWQLARLTLIDAELTKARELWAWYADPQHRRQVARAFAWWRAPHMLPSMLIGYTPLGEVRERLYNLGNELAGQVVALAGRPVRAAGRTRVDALREARTAYTSAMSASMLLRPSLAAARRLEEAQDRFWDLLVGTQWRDLGPTEALVDDKALTADWTTEHGMLLRRRELVRLAVGTDRVVVHGSAGTTPRIEVVPGSS